ncbi:DUF3017 domain-containing protein [Nocardioides sp. GXQ0305]|uniref:DUF3017 domain-containing protein n=1 Tax=Nocardioides sp. GXQ0305 TaxID=3423912 RepID=UPI003D7C9927
MDERPDAGIPVPPEEPPRRYPSTIGGALYLVSLLGVGCGLVIVMIGDWRLGVRFAGGSLLFAAACRLLLPRHHAGMLAVRNRWFDTAVLSLLGGALVVLAGSIPNQPL